MKTKRPALTHLKPHRSRAAAARTRHVSKIKHRIRQARPLHKKLLLHPATVMVLLITGVLIVGWTYRVVADDYSITAKVAASPLTESATITSPLDGAAFTTSPITVTGTCPDNSYVKLTRNGNFSGVDFCHPNHTYSIQTSLTAGANDLNVQDYNVTDDPGPTTPDITVTYNPPVPPPATGGDTTPPSGSSSASPAPLSLSSDYHFQGTTLGSTFTWELTLHGGATPYDVNVDWGDNQTSRYTIPAEQTFTITHTYRTVGYFTVKVKATDAKGLTTLLQLFAYIRPIITPNGSINEADQPPSLFGAITQTITQSRWLWLAWPVYIVVALMAVSYWLGEREAVREQVKRASPRKPDRHPNP